MRRVILTLIQITLVVVGLVMLLTVVGSWQPATSNFDQLLYIPALANHSPATNPLLMHLAVGIIDLIYPIVLGIKRVRGNVSNLMVAGAVLLSCLSFALILQPSLVFKPEL